MCVKKTLEKMRSTGHSAFSAFPTELEELESELARGRIFFWVNRKTHPQAGSFQVDLTWSDKGSSIIDKDKDPLGLWSTLMLFLGRIREHSTIVHMSELKQPREAVPEEFWEDLNEDQIEVFTSRLEALFKALGRPQFPSFEELLEIYCGGSLVQACSFCFSFFSVAAVYGEVEGYKSNTPLVRILPCLPPLFSCGTTPCDQQIQIKAS